MYMYLSDDVFLCFPHRQVPIDDIYADVELGPGPDDDFWFEDDSGFSRPSPGGVDSLGGVSKEELKLDLNAITQPPQAPPEVVIVVPHTREQVLDVMDSTIDVYWEKRR